MAGRRITCTECRKRRVCSYTHGCICDRCEDAIHEHFRQHWAAREKEMEKQRVADAKAYNDEMWPGDPNRYLGTSLGKAV